MFTSKDLEEFKKRGITPEQVEAQLALFRKGFPFADIRRPATPGDGILVLDKEEEKRLAGMYEQEKERHSLVKFVPASGAASRMFKALFAYHEAWEKSGKKKGMPRPEGEMARFFGGLGRFAFSEILNERLRAHYGKGIEDLLIEERYGEIVEAVLFPSGLGYGSLPKGLILFHRYPDEVRTAFEEHLAEGALYARDGKGRAVIHFTVSPEHRKRFEEKYSEKAPSLSKRYGTTFAVDYSVQKPSTDTVAVDPENNPFRKEDGTILFRPGGHGALLENLNDLKEEIIFIKNIDNVVPDPLKGDTVHYKKVLGGLLLELTGRIHHWLHRMDRGTLPENELQEAERFARKELLLQLPEGDLPAGERQKQLYELLHRPVRVCGMVRNEGEPGGGPFWVAGKDGRLSLQIVESAQIDMNDPEKKAIVSQATHFNPVDIVCSVRDHRGEKFDLRKFVDPDTFFISSKSYDGRELKALELPGLWNGSMAHWTTLFVEVPATTFNPVKTVNDLLRPEHLAADPLQ